MEQCPHVSAFEVFAVAHNETFGVPHPPHMEIPLQRRNEVLQHIGILTEETRADLADGSRRFLVLEQRLLEIESEVPAGQRHICLRWFVNARRVLVRELVRRAAAPDQATAGTAAEVPGSTGDHTAGAAPTDGTGDGDAW